MVMKKHQIAELLTRHALSADFAEVPHRKREWVRMTAQDLRRDPSLAEELFQLIKKAYAAIGGHVGLKSPRDLTDGSIAFFDVVDIDSEPDADAVALIKKKPAGEKQVAMGHDGARASKDALLKHKAKALNKRGSFVEVSGAIAHIMLTRFNVPVVTSEQAVRSVLGKDIEWIGEHPSGKYPGATGWYRRVISGEPHMKIMLGKPKVSASFSAAYTKLPKRLKPRQINEVFEDWQERGNKVYDDSMPVMVPTSDLWPLREYTWTRESARSGFARVGDETVQMPGPMKWDAMKEDLAARGWDPKEPLYLEVGRSGGVKVGEGNHRLAVAMKLGIREVPVTIIFNTGKVTKSKKPEEVAVTPHAFKKAAQNQPKREQRKLSEKEERDISSLMDVLGF